MGDAVSQARGVFMLSMRELRRAGRILESFLPGRTLKRIVQPDASSLIFCCIDFGKNRTDLLLSCDSEYARVCVVEQAAIGKAATSSFLEFLRAHVAGAAVSGIAVSENDRQMSVQLDARPDRWKLYLSILGARSNIYLTDAAGRLVHSMRPLEDTRRDLNIGALWMDPPGSVPSEGSDRWEEVPDDLYLDAIGKEYGRLEIRRDAETIARKIGQALNRERTLLGRKLNRLQEDLAETRRAESYRKKGELLKTALHTLRPGNDSAAVTDYETGETVSIAMDPALSPAANMEAYFARYQKGARGAVLIQQQIGKLEVVRDELDSVESLLAAALEKDPPEKAALESIAARPAVRRWLGRRAPQKSREPSTAKSKFESEIPKRFQPKRYRTEDGLEIWVGRNDEGNDYLTTRLARGNDLFFHLEGYPGSHIILRTEGKTDPPSGSILDACELAVHFSKMKRAARADVHIAPVKNIRKPKGVKPGLVYVRQGKTIHLRRDPGRLENILASRIDG
jgi:predicted ribosome quality control (RQC) complex YloA/Tae2 family protein